MRSENSIRNTNSGPFALRFLSLSSNLESVRFLENFLMENAPEMKFTRAMCLNDKTEETLGIGAEKGTCCCFCRLSEELIAEILCRLPAKSLIKCKLLCKLWCRVITEICVPKMFASAPIGGFLYRSKHIEGNDPDPFVEYVPNHTRLLLKEANCLVVARPFSDLLPFKYASSDFCDCCNGLLLFVKPSVPQFYVCNPATRQCIEIPRHDAHDASRIACLAFDPAKSQHYKIVKFNDQVEPQLDIFSSDTGKWVTSPMPLEPRMDVLRMRRALYFDGALYQLAYGYGKDSPHSKYLARFDLHQLKAHLIKGPDGNCTDVNGFIGGSRGSLYYSSNRNLRLFIWLFDVSHCKSGRWILKHTICTRDLIDCPFRSFLHPLSSSIWFKPHAYDPDSEDMFFAGPRAIVRYHPGTKRIQALSCKSIFCGRVICVDQFPLFTYTPCLVVLKDFYKSC